VTFHLYQVRGMLKMTFENIFKLKCRTLLLLNQVNSYIQEDLKKSGIWELENL